MVEFGMAGFLVGYMLGLRFRVLVLLPVEIAAVAAALVAVLCRADWAVAMLGLASFGIATQIGYAFALARWLKPLVRAA